jgi:hypothetical protein
MSNLARIQWDFQEFVLRQSGAVHAHIATSARAPITARLGIYADAYRARVRAALEANYPAVAKVLGEADFAELAEDYVAAHDSRCFSIRYYGHALAHFLATEPGYKPAQFLADLAQWEWMMAEVFDSADAEPITVAALAGRQPADWAALRFTFHPSVRLLPLAWNAPQMWQALMDEAQRPRARAERQPVPWLLWRNELREWFRPLSEAEQQVLTAARGGATFGDLCLLLCDHCREDEAPARAAAYSRDWIESGLITALS